MKNIIFTLILVLFQGVYSFAQDEPANKTAGNDDGEIKTLFKKSGHHAQVGYFVAPEAAWTQFDGKNVFLGGLSMGVIVDHFFSVGLAGYGIMNSRYLWYPDIDTLNAQGAYLYGGYGGVKFEFRILPSAPVHVNFPILIGGGGLVYNTRTFMNYNHNSNSGGMTLDWDAFFVVEPGVMLELNLLRFLRFDAGVSYRYTPDLDLVNTRTSLINNFNAAISLKFGKF